MQFDDIIQDTHTGIEEIKRLHALRGSVDCVKCGAILKAEEWFCYTYHCESCEQIEHEKLDSWRRGDR